MANNLDILFESFNKKYKDNIAYKGVSDIVAARIPFSSPRANYMLYGGLPRKRMIEFFGDFSCGKTTTALDIIANAQQLFAKEAEETGILKHCAIVDTEHTLDYDWALKLGVDVENLYVLDPLEQSAEQILQMVLDMVETGDVGLIVLDSLANMVSQQAMDKTLEEKTMCGISAGLTTFCNKAAGLLSKYDCTFIGINQVREDTKSAFNLYSTPGGKSWKLNCSVRLQFQAGDPVDAEGDVIKEAEKKSTPEGNQIKMSIKKTKVCKPNRKTGFYTLMYDEGIDKYADAFDLGQKEGIFVGKGWYSILDIETGEYFMDDKNKAIQKQGRKNMMNFLKENDEIYSRVESLINRIIEGEKFGD